MVYINSAINIGYILTYIKNVLNNNGPRIGSFIKNILFYIWKVAGIYIIWILTHFIASHLYIYFCTPLTIVGFLTAPFLIASPHCYGLRWAMLHGADTITAMWVILGTWFVTMLIQ